MAYTTPGIWRSRTLGASMCASWGPTTRFMHPTPWRRSFRRSDNKRTISSHPADNFATQTGGRSARSENLGTSPDCLGASAFVTRACFTIAVFSAASVDTTPNCESWLTSSSCCGCHQKSERWTSRRSLLTYKTMASVAISFGGVFERHAKFMPDRHALVLCGLGCIGSTKHGDAQSHACLAYLTRLRSVQAALRAA